MKTQKWNRFLRTVALLLVITLICPILLGAAPAQAQTESETEVIAKEKADEEVKAEEVSLISSAEVPNFISRDQIEELGHIARISEEETLNTLVYRNKDGTKTKYITRDPIKYTDASDKVQFIDLSLVEKTDAYETAANDILLSIAKDAAKGVSVAGDGIAVTLIAMPANQDSSGNITTAPMVTTTESNGAVTYNDLFGAGIDTRYTPLYNGVKEDIILEAYTGVSSFDFMLRTGGMEVFEDENGYYIAKEKDSAEQLRLGKVVAYDAKIRMREGTLLVTPIKAGEIYRLTVSVDPDFLNSSGTAYPVVIDPSIKVSDSSHGAGAIYDTPVYSGMPNSNFGSYQYNCIGYVDSSYKIGRVAIKLQGLINDSDYTKLSADAIQQVRFYVRDSSGSSAKAVNIYALSNLDSWSEGSLTWNNTLGNISSTLQASASIGSSNWTSFDITSLVKGWKNNDYSAASGFIMQGEIESVGTNIISTEYGSSSYWPYVTLTYEYGTAGGESFDKAPEIEFDSFVIADPVVQGEKRYFQFIPDQSGMYLFLSAGNGDPMIWLYNSSKSLIGSNDNGGGGIEFRLQANLIAGSKYYIALGNSGSNVGMVGLLMYRDANMTNGTYYLQNTDSDQYVDIHGPVEEKYPHQWSFHCALQEKWDIEKQSDGYYTIKSQYGAKKYVAISNTNADQNNVVLQSGISDAAKWSIFTDSGGTLILEPKNAPGKLLCTPNDDLGTELQLAWPSNFISRNTAWMVRKSDYDFTVKHYYDQGYDVRHTGASQAIYEYQCVCAEILLDVFGVSTTNYVVQEYTSIADMCKGIPVTLEDTTTGCSCSSINHKTQDINILGFASKIGMGNNTTANVVWIGHDLDSNRSCDFPNQHNILMLEHNTTRAMNISTLLHELSHELGARDHYCEGDFSPGGKCSNSDCWRCYKGKNPPTCIMTDGFRSYIECVVDEEYTEGLYCAQCTSDTHSDGILTHLKNHH